MRFDHILHEKSIGHLLRTSRDYFRPPPQKKSFRKEMDNIYAHFRRVFVEFVVLLTKIWPTCKYLFLALQLNVGEGAVQRAVFGPPPLSHQEVIDAI